MAYLICFRLQLKRVIVRLKGKLYLVFFFCKKVLLVHLWPEACACDGSQTALVSSSWASCSAKNSSNWIPKRWALTLSMYVYSIAFKLMLMPTLSADILFRSEPPVQLRNYFIVGTVITESYHISQSIKFSLGLKSIQLSLVFHHTQSAWLSELRPSDTAILDLYIGATHPGRDPLRGYWVILLPQGQDVSSTNSTATTKELPIWKLWLVCLCGGHAWIQTLKPL